MKLVIAYNDFEEYKSEWNDYGFTNEAASRISDMLMRFTGGISHFDIGDSTIRANVKKIEAICEDSELYTIIFHLEHGEIVYNLAPHGKLILSRYDYSIGITTED